MKVTVSTLVNIVLVTVLVSSLFFLSTGSMSENSESAMQLQEYDPWIDINDDGLIDVSDLVIMVDHIPSSGTPLNKTALLLELLDRVEMLENQMLPQGFIRAPAYDSGWINISQGEMIILTHNLNTTEIFVYVLGRWQWSLTTWYINQEKYGGYEYWYIDRYWKQGLEIRRITEDTIWLFRYPDDACWKQTRVMIWKIQEP